MKLLNISDEDRKNCLVIYNINRYEVCHADRYLLTAAYSKDDLKKQLIANKIYNPKFCAVASEQYLNDGK